MVQIRRSGLLGVRSSALMLILGVGLVANGSAEDVGTDGKVCIVRPHTRVKVDESSAIATPNINYGGKAGLSACVNSCALHPDCEQALWESSDSKCYRNKQDTEQDSDRKHDATTMRCQYRSTKKGRAQGTKVCKVLQMMRFVEPPQDQRIDTGDIKYGGSVESENACLTACTYAEDCMESTWSSKDKKCYPSKQAIVHDVTSGDGTFWTVQCIELSDEEKKDIAPDAQAPQAQAGDRNTTDASNSTDTSNSTNTQDANIVDDALQKEVSCNLSYDYDTCGTQNDGKNLTKTFKVNRAKIVAKELPKHKLKYSKEGGKCKDGFDHEGHTAKAAHLLVEDDDGNVQSIDLSGKGDEPVFVSKLRWSEGCYGTKGAAQMSGAEAKQLKKAAAKTAAQAAAAEKAAQAELAEEKAEKKKVAAKAKAAESAEKVAEKAAKKAKTKEEKEKAQAAAAAAKAKEEKDKAEQLALAKEGKQKKEKEAKAVEKSKKAGSKKELTAKGLEVAKLAKEKRNKSDKWFKKGHILFAQGIKYQGLLEKYGNSHTKLDAYHYKKELETYSDSFPTGFTAPLSSKDGELGNLVPAGSDPIDVEADPGDDAKGQDEESADVMRLD